MPESAPPAGGSIGINTRERRSLRQAEQVAILASETAISGSQAERRSARTRERSDAEKSGRAARAVARRPWRRRQRAASLNSNESHPDQARSSLCRGFRTHVTTPGTLRPQSRSACTLRCGVLSSSRRVQARETAACNASEWTMAGGRRRRDSAPRSWALLQRLWREHHGGDARDPTADRWSPRDQPPGPSRDLWTHVTTLGTLWPRCRNASS